MRKSTLQCVLVLMTIIWFSGCGYNMLQEMEEGVFKAWGNVESNLQRRSDLIPNLVEVVKGYARHERETLQGVILGGIEARTEADHELVAVIIIDVRVANGVKVRIAMAKVIIRSNEKVPGEVILESAACVDILVFTGDPLVILLSEL